MDTAIANFFRDMFLIEYINTDGYYQTTFNWIAFRRFALALLSILILILYFSVQYYISRWMRREREDIQNQILSILANPESGSLPEEYALLEANLIKYHLEASHQKELYEKEMAQKNDLITYLAHDLKTPLASVIGYLSFLSEASDLPLEQRQKYTDIALNKSYRLEELINQFFDITRFNLHTIVLQKEWIDLSMMLQQLQEEFYPLVKRKHGSIEIDAPENVQLYVDPDKFGRVLNNVLKNAVAYSYEKTAIQIHATIIHDQACIQIINQGKQIPEAKLAMIFEKFYRIDEARSSQSGGSGLGLAIAKEIMEAHQGSICAQSDEQETIFTIQVPVK